MTDFMGTEGPGTHGFPKSRWVSESPGRPHTTSPVNDYDELDDLVDLARETIRATREEQARIRAFQNEQPVTWGPRDTEYIDWREHGIA